MQPLCHQVRVRFPETLAANLETIANQLARRPSDIVREAVALHVARLARTPELEAA